jgi:nitrogen regulatory protein PII
MSTTLEEVRSVRIVCDPALKDGVLEKLVELRAPGFTWWEAHGKGHRETVPDVQTISGWHKGLGTERRVVIEVWCHPSVAEEIIAYCQGSQFKGIGMIAGIAPFWMHRDEVAKFAPK